MKMLRGFLLSVAIVGNSFAKDECSTADKECQPEQVHISFGEKPNQIWVTWSTLKDTDQPYVEYCNVKSCQKKMKKGISTLFVDGGSLRNKQTIHRCLLDDLEYNTTYQYKAGSKHGWSGQLSFTTVPEGDEWTVHALIFGDLGLNNSVSLPFLIDDQFKNQYAMAFHMGDFAYDMYEENGTIGDLFMNKMQPLAAALPYMVCPGNHEEAYNYSHYRNRFTMPLYEKFDSYFYSFNLGPAHFISVNIEVYYEGKNNDFVVDEPTPSMMTQYHWLVDDLKEANKPENRQKHPWIIILGHRPMVCSVADNECKREFPARVGLLINGTYRYGMEVLLKDYGVDLAIWAHQHSYERMWPMYDKKVYNGSKEHPYTNPGAPVHFTSGNAGNKEGQNFFCNNTGEWSAFHSADYGYARLHIYNHTHLHVEQISTKHVPRPNKNSLDEDDNIFPKEEIPKTSKLLDEFWIIKDSPDSHKPYDML